MKDNDYLHFLNTKSGIQSFFSKRKTWINTFNETHDFLKEIKKSVKFPI